MGLSSPSIDEEPATCKPLRIIVSEAGQAAALKALVAQCIPILHDPSAFSVERRQELAQRLTCAICPGRRDEEPANEPEYEPESWLEEDP